jgi:hypothetical protein
MRGDKLKNLKICLKLQTCCVRCWERQGTCLHPASSTGLLMLSRLAKSYCCLPGFPLCAVRIASAQHISQRLPDSSQIIARPSLSTATAAYPAKQAALGLDGEQRGGEEASELSKSETCFSLFHVAGPVCSSVGCGGNIVADTISQGKVGVAKTGKGLLLTLAAQLHSLQGVLGTVIVSSQGTPLRSTLDVRKQCTFPLFWNMF